MDLPPVPDEPKPMLRAPVKTRRTWPGVVMLFVVIGAIASVVVFGLVTEPSGRSPKPSASVSVPTPVAPAPQGYTEAELDKIAKIAATLYFSGDDLSAQALLQVHGDSTGCVFTGFLAGPSGHEDLNDPQTRAFLYEDAAARGWTIGFGTYKGQTLVLAQQCPTP